MLGLEDEVALTHDDDGEEEEQRLGLDSLNLSLDQGELLARLCVREALTPAHTHELTQTYTHPHTHTHESVTLGWFGGY